MRKTEHVFHEWLLKAAEDELSAAIIIKEKGPPCTVCFLSQQMAEKYLKSLLVYHAQPFPKVHDLIHIESLLLKYEPDIKKIHKDAKLLNRYYIETRYPGNYPDFSWTESKLAFAAALNVKKYVTGKIIY